MDGIATTGMSEKFRSDEREFGEPTGRSRSEVGSALVLSLMIMVIMTLLGLAFMLVGQTEANIARNKLDAEQALFTAEGGARIVKLWFEAPSGASSYLVPTTSQMNRTLRYVDDNNDGTYAAYSSATSPYNVTYRQGTDDPFERPYRGTPALTYLGIEDHPDIRISETGSSGEQAYLTSLNDTLYPAFPQSVQRSRITQIDVYGPPILLVSGSRIRYGVATIKVTAGVSEHVGTAAERRIATRVVKAVINEIPFAGPGGPLQSDRDIDFNGNFGVHWGKVTAARNISLPNNLDMKVDSSVPWYNRDRIIARDMDLNGTLQTSTTVATPDDQDHDGALDFDTWIASNNVEDPWLRYWAEADIPGVSPGCASPDCQPSPWIQGSSFGSGSNDHSNLSKNVSTPTFPTFEYAFWKDLAQKGGTKVYYYASDGAGTGTYKLNGTGTSVSFITATDGRTGLFFFDTATNSPPVDTDGNGLYDNLSDDVSISGGGYASGGFVYMNANFRTTGSGSAPNVTIIAPSEPYIDLNGNGQCDSDEYFVELTYPNAINGSYAKTGMRRAVDGYTRKDPFTSTTVGGRYSVGVNFYGVLYTNGAYDAKGNWIYYGSVVTKEGQMTGSSGTPDIYFDERLVTGKWPPPELGLPRTTITSWETDQ